MTKEVTELPDFLGRMIKVGTPVVFRSRYPKCLRIGVVKKLYRKTADLDVEGNHEDRVYLSDIIRMPRDV